MTRFRSALLIAVAFGFAQTVVAQDKKPDDKAKPEIKKDEKKDTTKTDAKKPTTPPGTPTPEEMAAYEKCSTPNENHKLLECMIGEWTTTTKMRMTEEAPWEESTGTCNSKWIMDGRFVQSEYKGTLMGQPFLGLATTGYDNLKEKFVGTWVGNCCTSITTSEGTFDPSTKTFTWKHEMQDPMNPKTTIKVRHTEKFLTKDKYVFEWFETKAGAKEAKTMEITYTRKPAA